MQGVNCPPTTAEGVVEEAKADEEQSTETQSDVEGTLTTTVGASDCNADKGGEDHRITSAPCNESAATVQALGATKTDDPVMDRVVVVGLGGCKLEVVAECAADDVDEREVLCAKFPASPRVPAVVPSESDDVVVDSFAEEEAVGLGGRKGEVINEDAADEVGLKVEAAAKAPM